MRRLLIAASLASFTACLDFDQAFSKCTEPGGRCTFAFDASSDLADAGSSDASVTRLDAGPPDAGPSALDAGPDAGAGDAGGMPNDAGEQTLDAGGAFDAGDGFDAGSTVDSGSAVDAGPSCTTGCVSNSLCVASVTNALCGAGGAACVDCTLTGQICGAAGGCTQRPLSWQRVYSPRSGIRIGAISAVSADDVWFVGPLGTVVQYFDGGFIDAPFESGNSVVFTQGTAGEAHVFIAGTSPTKPYITDLFEPWAGADAGRRATFANSKQISAVFATRDGIFAAGGDGGAHQLYRYDGDGGWADISTAESGRLAPATGGWASPTSSDFYTVGGTDLAHFQGDGGLVQYTLPHSAEAVWGTANALYIVGEDMMVKFQDAGFSDLTVGSTHSNALWFGVWAADDSNVFIVGEEDGCAGRIYKYNGVSLEPTCIGSSTFSAVGGVSSADVWATNYDGGIFHFTR